MSKIKQVIGHRGAAAYAPENTLTSFQKALELGCNYIEFDVSESLDGELFVFHDNAVNRTTNGVGNFNSLDSSYIKSLDAGGWFAKNYRGLKIPTFKQAIDWLIMHNMQANIEIKPIDGNAIRLTTNMLAELDKYWPKNKPKPVISSFDYNALLVCHDYDKSLPIALLFNSLPDNWSELAKRINCFAINISCKLATKRKVKAILEKGYEVNIYTVNSKRLAIKYFDWGASAVFSDYPDLMVKNNLLNCIRSKFKFKCISGRLMR